MKMILYMWIVAVLYLVSNLSIIIYHCEIYFIG